MKNICFYFQVHQPFRLRTYRFFDIGNNVEYYDEQANRGIMRKVAEKCYLPANALLLDLINSHNGRFNIAFSISGTALDQFEMYAPDVLDSFRQLAATGCVEFLSETYSHSLAALDSADEFRRQVRSHAVKIQKLFGQHPRVFRNTELIYSDRIGRLVKEMGYSGMLTEGAAQVLGWKSPNFLYESAENPGLKLLLKNYRLSDDIAFRFSQQSWSAWPLTSEKYRQWLSDIPPYEKLINLFMDYETFGEHQWSDSGIFDFVRAFVSLVATDENFAFIKPSDAIAAFAPVGEITVPEPVSWADEARDLTAWLGNELQNDAFASLYRLEEKVRASDDPALLRDWDYLQTSDHFYYMCTKYFADGDVHKYFNHYQSPYQAFVNYMNVLSDFERRLELQSKPKPRKIVGISADESVERELPELILN